MFCWFLTFWHFQIVPHYANLQNTTTFFYIYCKKLQTSPHLDTKSLNKILNGLNYIVLLEARITLILFKIFPSYFRKTTSGSKHRKWEIKAKKVETKRVIIEESCCWKLYDNDGTEKLLKRGSHILEMFYIKEFSSDNC